MSKLNNKALGIVNGLLSSGLQTVISIISAFLIIRFVVMFLPQEISGIWFLFTTIGAYIAFLDFGISPTVSREISFIIGSRILNEEEKNIRIANIIKTTIVLFRIVALFAFFIGAIFGGMYLWEISPVEYQSTILNAWVIFTMGASLNLLGGAWLAGIYGLGYVATERLIRSVSLIIGFVLSILMLYWQFGIIGLAIAWSLQGIFARILAWFYLYKLNPQLRVLKGTYEKNLIKKIVLPSIKWAITGLGAILILQTDNIVIASTVGPSSIPEYEAVAKILITLTSFSSLINTTLTPHLSRAFASDEMGSFVLLMMRNVRYAMAFILCLSVFLAINGKQIIDIWLGSGNFVGYSVLWTMLIMLVLETHHVILASATMSTGRIIFYWVAILSGILNLIISFTLVNYLGLWGVALGTLISQILTNNWYVPYITLKVFKISKSEYLRKTLIPLMIFTLLVGSCNYIIYYLFEQKNTIVYIFFVFIFNLIISGKMTFLVIMSHDEREFVLRKLRIRNLRKA